MTIYHVPFFPTYQLTKRIIFLEIRKNPMKKKDKADIPHQKEKSHWMTRKNIGWYFKVSSSFWMNHFITQGSDVNIDAKNLKKVLINLLKHQRKVFERVLRDPKVEEDIHTTQSKIVEKAEEVYADRHRSSKCSYNISSIWS